MWLSPSFSQSSSSLPPRTSTCCPYEIMCCISWMNVAGTIRSTSSTEWRQLPVLPVGSGTSA